MRKIFWILVKTATAAAVMWVVVRAADLRSITGALSHPARPSLLWAAAALLPANLFLQWLRWHALLRLVNPSAPAWESFTSLMGGMVAGFITPGRVGEIGRTLFLDHEDRLEALGLVVLDKFYAFVPVLAGGVWGLVLLLAYRFDYAPYLCWPLFLLALLVSGLSLALVLHPAWLRALVYGVSVLLPAREKLHRIVHCLDRFDRPAANVQTALAFLLYAVYIFQFCLLAGAFQAMPWTTAFTATTCVILAKTLVPLSIGDLGIREGAAVYFFLRFNVEKAAAFNASLLLFAVNVLVPTLIGLFFLPRMGSKKEPG